VTVVEWAGLFAAVFAVILLVRISIRNFATRYSLHQRQRRLQSRFAHLRGLGIKDIP
jgi:hypothetical protein